MKEFLSDFHAGKPTAGLEPHRLARVQVIVRDEAPNALFEMIVDLDKYEVVEKEWLFNKHSFIDPAYMKAVEKACLEDSKVQDAIRKLSLPAGATVCIEPWAYAPDGTNDMSKRITMVMTLRLPSCVMHYLSLGYVELIIENRPGFTCVLSTTLMQTTMHIL